MKALLLSRRSSAFLLKLASMGGMAFILSGTIPFATQARAEALRAVEQQASAEAARERFTRFIGDGHAYARGK